MTVETCARAAVSGIRWNTKVVRKERLELSRLSAPDPKSGASTNSATFANIAF